MRPLGIPVSDESVSTPMSEIMLTCDKDPRTFNSLTTSDRPASLFGIFTTPDIIISHPSQPSKTQVSSRSSAPEPVSLHPVPAALHTPVHAPVHPPADALVGTPVDAPVDAPVDEPVDAPGDGLVDVSIYRFVDAPVDALVDGSVEVFCCNITT